MKKCYIESRRRGNSYKRREGKLTDSVKTLLRNCHITQVIEGKIEGKTEMKGRRWKRSKQLLGGLKEKIEVPKVEGGKTMSHPVRGRGFGRIYMALQYESSPNESTRRVRKVKIHHV
jgi:hypothetical protein